MTLLLQLLAGFVVFATFWATIPRFEWWFRVADFPRNQLIFWGWWRSLAYFGWALLTVVGKLD